MQLKIIYKISLFFLLTLCAREVKSQYTYALYGGAAFHSEDTSQIQYKDHYIYLLSESDQKARITNYRDFDTTLTLLAGQIKVFKIPRKLVSLPIEYNGSIKDRGAFLLSSKPVKVLFSPLVGLVPTTSDPFDLGLSGSYSVLEKKECGNRYNIYYARTILGYTNVNNKSSSSWSNTVIAYEDSTWVDFDLQFETELGKKFSVLLNKGQIVQLSQQQYPSNISKYWPNKIGNSQILSRDCNKTIAVFNSNIGTGLNLDPIKFNIDLAIYASVGIEIEELQPTNKWGYEYLLVSDGESYMGNTYHINNIGPNEILFNGQLKKFSRDTLIYDTIFGRTLLLQSRKPIMVVQHVSGAKNYSAFGAPNDRILANVIDITTSPPTHNLIKKISVPIPSRVGTNLINRLVLFSPGNRRITVNGKNRILTKQYKGIYYGSIHNPDTVVNIESTTGFNGYVIHTGANDTTYFSRTGSPMHRSGVFSFSGDWDTVKPRIRINKQGVYWLGVDDTGIVSVCQNSSILAELEVGWKKLKSVKCSINDSLINQSDSVRLTFHDTGLFDLKFEYVHSGNSCDTSTTNKISRRIRVFLEPAKLAFNDTLLCSKDTLKIIASMDPESRVTWNTSVGSICDTCKILRYVPVMGQINQLNLKITRTGCPFLLDTVFVSTYDSLKLQSTIENSYCYGTDVTLSFSEEGGDSTRRKLLHFLGNDAIAFPLNLSKSDTLMSILSDGCSQLNDTLIQIIKVLDPLLIYGPMDTTVCSDAWVIPSKWHIVSGGKSAKLTYEDYYSGEIIKDSIQIKKDQKVRVVAIDDCSKNDTMVLHILIPQKMELADKKKLRPNYCLNDSIDFTWKISGGIRPITGTIELPGGSLKQYFDSTMDGYKPLLYGVYKINLQDNCNNKLTDSVLILKAQKTKILDWNNDSICPNRDIEVQFKVRSQKLPYYLSVYGESQELLNSQWYSDSILKINLKKEIHQSNNQIMVIANDQCAETDTQILFKKYFNKPELIISNEVQLCETELLNLAYTIKNKHREMNLWVDMPSGISRDSSHFYGNPKHGDQIQVTITDPCFGDFDSIIIIERIPRIEELPWDTQYCSGQEIILYPLRWNGGAPQPALKIKLVENQNDVLKSHEILSGGNVVYVDSIRLYTSGLNELSVKVQKITGETCFEWKKDVNIIPSPHAQFKLLKEPIVVDQEFTAFNYSENSNRFQWYIDGKEKGNTTHLKEYFTDTLVHWISLWAWNEQNCEDSTMQYYKVSLPTQTYWPNAFTPNDDSLNSTWYPQGINIRSYQIRIYNRWGEKVFEGNPNQPFNGMYQGKPLPEGVYVAVVEIEDIQHQRIIENKTLILIRNE